MRGYDRDEYEDLDEYEEEDGEEYEEEGGEEEYEEEETHQPTQEELEFIELRQRLKEDIRKKMKKGSGAANSSKTNAPRKDNFGSFFGPSQPSIAPRVIQESKSLLENPNLVARIAKCRQSMQANKSSASPTTGSKPRADNPPRVRNGVKTKVEMLKNTRDYSFLLSDDAEVPAPTKNPPPRNVSAPSSEARSAQVPPRGKEPVKDSSKKPFAGHQERRPVPAGGQQPRPKVGSEKLATSTKPLLGSKQKLGMNNGSGPGRPVGMRDVPSRDGSGPGWPVGMKDVPSRNPTATTGKKVTAPIAKNSFAGERKPNSSHLQSQQHKPMPLRLQHQGQKPAPQSSVNKKPLTQRNESQEIVKPKVVPKQPMSSSRPQAKLAPKSAARGSPRDERPKRKPMSRYDDDSPEDVRSMIRQMFGYNPNKYQDDDDVSDMEANFDDILAEEKRSELIARKEDEEQLRLIEEEERRERMRLAKRQKR